MLSSVFRSGKNLVLGTIFSFGMDKGYGQDVESKLVQKLLFFHQSKEQKRLMRKYGNHIGLLDATYKTTRYAIPLFFVLVKTNVDYQIAGSFSVHKETTEAIA